MNGERMCRVAFELCEEGTERFFGCPYVVSVSYKKLITPPIIINVQDKILTFRQFAEGRFNEQFYGKSKIPQKFHIDYFLDTRGKEILIQDSSDFVTLEDRVQWSYVCSSKV